ncbi:MAG TPA: hypothetical protein VGK81_14115, partial [Anaerolineae bacterium]
MASTPPPPRDPSDDWRIPKSESPSGNWESDEVQPAARQRQTLGNMLQPVADTLRGPFGTLWDDPRGRSLILVSLVAMIGVCALACFIVAVVLVSNNNSSTGPIDSTAIAEATKQISVSLVINANNTPIPAGVPSRLTVGNNAFSVVATRPDQNGQW